ncbi:hypothetical protein BJY01DRAFT_262590 [Aspergillus pseudoustus]|uniref:Uncharacterized protein n=1 Tax=Aspergillus pseudoustus TaxID=1810923 RepID=A0ABR4ICU0_9EURO
MSPAILPLSAGSIVHNHNHNHDNTKRESRTIQTSLKYWRKPAKRVTGEVVSIDFRKPDAEHLFDELQTLEEDYPVIIRDIRGNGQKNGHFTLQTNGFQYIHDPVPEYDERWDEKRIARFFLPRTEELVRRLLTGTSKVLLYMHRIRCHHTGPRSPAHIVHADFTPSGALQHLKTLISPAELAHIQENANTRILALNIWRPLHTVTRDPLALCDWASINPEEDIIPNRFVFSDGWLEVAKVAYSTRHRWWYCSSQSPDEVVVFKQFDSAEEGGGGGGASVVHSAFVDPESVDGEPRRSLEAGVFVFIPL